MSNRSIVPNEKQEHLHHTIVHTRHINMVQATDTYPEMDRYLPTSNYQTELF